MPFKYLLSYVVVMCGSTLPLVAQDSTSSLTISAYTEAYFSYDFNDPPDNKRPSFLYSHNRHKEFNVNLAFLKASYTSNRSRGNLAFAAGSYMNSNYAAEQGVLKNIFEANAGIRIGKKSLWLDAGILPSHIGFESAVSKDCWNLTRSMAADNSPYFEAGARLTYESVNGKWLISGLILNGWQRIARLPGNSMLSWGTQVQFKPNKNLLLNSSSFIGTDTPDSTRRIRLFHNFYGIYQVTDELGITIGLDTGIEEKALNAPGNNKWYSPLLIVKYRFGDAWTISSRFEYYSDKNGVIINTGTPNGFKTSGLSLNLDHSPEKNIIVRLEIRGFNSKDAVFTKNAARVKSNTSVTSSIAVSF
jgi:hypothetical protein